MLSYWFYPKIYLPGSKRRLRIPQKFWNSNITEWSRQISKSRRKRIQKGKEGQNDLYADLPLEWFCGGANGGLTTHWGRGLPFPDHLGDAGGWLPIHECYRKLREKEEVKMKSSPMRRTRNRRKWRGLLPSFTSTPKCKTWRRVQMMKKKGMDCHYLQKHSCLCLHFQAKSVYRRTVTPKLLSPFLPLNIFYPSSQEKRSLQSKWNTWAWGFSIPTGWRGDHFICKQQSSSEIYALSLKIKSSLKWPCGVQTDICAEKWPSVWLLKRKSRGNKKRWHEIALGQHDTDPAHCPGQVGASQSDAQEQIVAIYKAKGMLLEKDAKDKIDIGKLNDPQCPPLSSATNSPI